MPYISSLCNNSPQFLNRPIPFVYIGQNVSFSQGVSDPDNDSLVFSLTDCKEGRYTNVSYIPPYSSQAPLDANNFSLDSSTGNISFVPLSQQVGVLAVLIEEYRNGIKIGEVVRDIQFTVLNTSNNLPTASGINGTSNYQVTACVGEPLNFTVISNDADAPTQQVTMTWDASITQANFVTSNAALPVGTFTWTPSNSDIGNHLFSIEVEDNACDLTGQNIYSYLVNVVPSSNADFSFTSNNTTVNFTNLSSHATNYQWDFGNGTTSTASDPSITYTSGGVYNVCLFATSVCGGIDSFCNPITITSSTNPCNPTVAFWQSPATTGNDATLFISPTALPTANGDPLPIGTRIGLFDNLDSLWGLGTWQGTTLSISAKGDEGLSVKNGFYTGDTIFVKVQLPTGEISTSTQFTFVPAGTSIIDHTHTYSDGKILGLATLNATYTPFSPITATAGFTFSNTGLTYNFNNTSTDAVSYLWNFGTGSASTATNPTYIFTTAGNYMVCLYATSICGTTDTFCQNIQVTLPNPCGTPPVINNVLAYNPTTCLSLDGEITIEASSGNPPFEYSIDGGTTWQAGDTFKLLDAGNYFPRVKNVSDTCVIADFDIVLTKPNLLTIDSLNLQSPSNCNVNDGSIMVFASGNGFIDYAINGQGQLSNVFNNLNAANYTITINNSDGTCPIDTLITLSANTGTPPVADFDFTQTGLSIILENYSSQFDTIEWDMGDGTILNSNDTIVTYTYANTGNFTICLTASNACSDSTFCRNITLNNPCNSSVLPTWTAPIATGENATVIFPNSIALKVNGLDLPNGSQVGIFDNQDTLWGVGTYQTGQSFSITVYGNDGSGAGFNANEIYYLKIQLPNGVVTDNVIATFKMPDNVFVSNTNDYTNDGVSIVTALMANYGITDTTIIDITTCDISQVGQTIDTLTNATGCDSVIITNTILDVNCNTSSCGILSDTLQLNTCDLITDYCLNIPFNSINDYEIRLDGNLYNGSSIGCDYDTALVYFLGLVFNGGAGPYDFTWSVNGNILNTTIQDFNGLVNQMNTWDTQGNWVYDASLNTITGGNTSNTYGTLQLEHIPTNSPSLVGFNHVLIANGTSISINNTNSYITILDTITGCSDTAIIHFINNASDTTVLNIYTCDISQVGQVVTVLQNHNNCDSVIVTTYLDGTSPITQLNLTTCNSNEVGQTIDTLFNQYNCDSIIIRTTTLLPSDTTVLNIYTCDISQVGQVVTVLPNHNNCDSVIVTNYLDGTSPITQLNLTTCNSNEVGQTIDTLPNQYNCDSIIIRTTTLLPSDTTVLNIYTCDISQVGQVVTVLPNINNCDSVIVTNYLDGTSSITQLNLTTCNSNEVGQTIDTLFNQYNCDSIIIRNTTLLPSDTTVLNIYTCDISQVGQVVTVLPNINNCDSVIVTNYLDGTSPIIQLNLTTCNSNEVGQTIDTLSNQYNCDSIIIRNTTLLPSDTTNLIFHTCNPTQIGGQVINILTNINDCDSIVITDYLDGRSPITTLDLTTCDANLVGQVIDTLPNQYNCDSIIIRNTTLLPSDTTQLTIYTCDASQIGQVVNILPNINTCDSVIITNYLDGTSPITTLNLTTCDTNLVGQVIDTLPNQHNCDSIIITNTTLLPSDLTQLTVYSCDANLVGQVIDTLPNQHSCDSIIITNTILLPSDTTHLADSTCNPLEAGVFATVVQNFNGCDSTIIRTVTLLTSPILIISSDTIICAGDSVQLLVSGGLNYNWQPSTDLSDSTIANPIASPSLTTIYTVIGTSIEGCADTASVTISVNSSPSVSINETASITCFNDNNGSLTATATNGTAPFNYDWNTTSTTNVISNLGAGNYTITVTDALGCIDSVTYQLQEPDVLQLDSFVSVGATCNLTNGMLTVYPTGGTLPYSYSWTNGDDTQTADSLSAGLQTVFVTDANGCVQSFSEMILEINRPVATSITDHPMCYNGNTGSIEIVMISGTPPFTYLWDNGDTTPIRTGLYSGYYSATITDANGCYTVFTDTLHSPSPILLNYSSIDPNCNASDGSLTALVSGGIAPYTYLWSNGDTTNVINNLPQGYYTVTVTDDNGCEEESASDIFLNGNFPSADITSLVTDGNAQFYSNAQNATSYFWDFGNDSTSTLENPLMIYDTSGFYTITLIVSNSCGSDTSIVDIEIIRSAVKTIYADNIKATIVPNPNNGQFRLEVEDLPIGDWNMEIYSITGQLIQRESIRYLQGIRYLPISLKEVGAGLYLLRMVNDDGVVVVRKFVVGR